MTDTGRPFVEEEEKVSSLVGRLVDETRGLASAEIALYKARIGERLAAYKSAAVFFAIAGVLGLAGLIALLVGLIETFATLIGPGWATVAVVATVFVVAAVLALVGKGRLAAPRIEP